MDHHSNEETEEPTETQQSTLTGNNEETDIAAVQGDQRVWVKSSGVLFTGQIKEEISESEYPTIIDIKDEVEEIEEDEVKIDPVICEPTEPQTPPPPPVGIQLKKVAIPKLQKKIVSKKAKKPRGRMGRRPRPILPMTRPIAPANTSHLEQPQTSHQIIMPSSQLPGIAYQIFLGDHGKNSNNPVQYTMLQPQPVFLQQTPTSSVSSPSPVVISQPSMVMNQPYQMTQAKIPPLAKISKIAPKLVGQSNCTFCYKIFNNMNEHVKECWANPDSKKYMFRKIAPSIPL